MQMEKMQKLRNRRETWNSRRIICFVVSCCDICVFCLCMFCLGAPACQIGGKALRGARRPGNACEERIGRAKEQIAVSFFDVYALFLLFCFSFEASDADFHACWTTATMTTTAFTVGSTGWIPHGTLFRRILTAFFLLINFLFIIYCFFSCFYLLIAYLFWFLYSVRGSHGQNSARNPVFLGFRQIFRGKSPGPRANFEIFQNIKTTRSSRAAKRFPRVPRAEFHKESGFPGF